jgi:hypothetical protein
MHTGKEIEAHWIEKGRLSCISDGPHFGTVRSDSTTVVKWIVAKRDPALYMSVYVWYILTAIGLTLRDISTEHIYTQTINRKTEWNRIHKTYITIKIKLNKKTQTYQRKYITCNNRSIQNIYYLFLCAVVCSGIGGVKPVIWWQQYGR